MIYRNWNIITAQEYNGMVVDCVDPNGNKYREPYCFCTYDEAVNYGKLCVDQSIRLEARQVCIGTHRGQLSPQGQWSVS